MVVTSRHILTIVTLCAVGLFACSSDGGDGDSTAAGENGDGQHEIKSGSSFACGASTCKSNQYCETTTSGRAGGGAARTSCETAPAACKGSPTCACLGINPIHGSCTTTAGHSFVKLIGQ